MIQPHTPRQASLREEPEMRYRELVKLYQLHISMKLIFLVLATTLGCSTLPPSEQAAWRRWNPELGVQPQGTVIGGLEGYRAGVGGTLYTQQGVNEYG